MKDAISNVAPMLRQCQWPTFDQSQIDTIKKKLGY